MMTVFYGVDGGQIATVAIDDAGQVTTTGVGDRIVDTVMVFTPVPELRHLTPADGSTWLRALADEVSRSGYYGVEIVP